MQNINKMKLAILPILFFGFTACAQQSHVDRFYEKYRNTSEKDGLWVSPSFLFQASFTSKEVKDNDNWLRKITKLECLSIDSGNDREWEDLSKSLRKDDFEEWFSVRHGKERVQLLSHEGVGDIGEIVCVLAGKEGKGLFFHLRGHFSAADKDRVKAMFDDPNDK